MDRLDGFVVAAFSPPSSGCCAADSRRPGAVCWCGDVMKSQTLRAKPERSAPAFVDRTVTLLGATGSIGASTVDLLKRERERYRVEAVSAHRSAAALAALARELGARFAAVGDPAAYAELKDALAGTGIEAGAGESALIEAAQRPADWVIGAITGAAGLAADLGGGRTRRDRCARQQGNPGLRRRPVHAPGGRSGRDRAAGRFRAQCAVPGDERKPPRGRAPRHPDGVRRPVPHRERGGDRERDPGAGAQASELVDGAPR